MYKIEGEDLYLIGTSEHSMISKFIDTMLDEAELPKTLTSYSPCFRKEKELMESKERGVYRIHQFEKQGNDRCMQTRRKQKNGYDKLWKTLLTCSVLLISRFVHWNAVQVTLPTLK